MLIQKLYQLPRKLAQLRASTGQSQKSFAAHADIDASHWCALERGRRRVATRGALDELASRLHLSTGACAELLSAFEHDQVLESLCRTQLPPEAVVLISRCLQASLLLNADELNGLADLVASTLRSKQQLNEIARRAQAGKEVAMD